MKKILLNCFFFLLSLGGLAQNVGINTPNPQYQLDVDGHINTTGTIVANGDKGKAGQMLVKNSVNELVWSDICGYKNFMHFRTSNTFQIQDGVIKMVAELWSGGGGGNILWGGAGGSYAKVLFTVNSGETMTITVGASGNGGDSTIVSTSGGSTIINYGKGASTQNIDLFGGLGANVSNFGLGNSNYNITNNLPHIFYRGNDGYPPTYQYAQVSNTEFIKQTYHGRGGDGAQNLGSGGLGGQTHVVSTTGGGTITTDIRGQRGQSYGGGGGGRGSIGGTT